MDKEKLKRELYNLASSDQYARLFLLETIINKFAGLNKKTNSTYTNEICW